MQGSIIEETNQNELHGVDYTIKNPETSNAGDMYYTNSDGFCYEIDWNNKRVFTLEDYFKAIEENSIPENEQIISWDEDDGNIIEFEEIIITDKYIILI